MSSPEPTILVVDDDPLNHKLIRACLVEDGYRVLEATNGRDALEKAKSQPELILMDIKMTEMDGFEVCRRLKVCDQTRDIPVVFLSALKDMETRVKCFEMGGVDYLSRPFEARELLARIRRHLQQRQQEIHFREYVKSLEQQVKEGSTKLFLSNRLANLGALGAGIAHEIRNPLSGLHTLLDGIEKNFEDPHSVEDIRALLVEAKNASLKIESVVEGILDFLRPGTSKLTLSDVNIPLRDALNLSRKTMQKTGIKIEEELMEELPRVYMDRQLIEQVILNLINNGAEAMKKRPDPKILKISSLREMEKVVIKVADSGEGVPDALREKIFEPFFTTKDEGSGIGLSLCQRIIHEHGGTIKAYASGWGGLEFRIEIPIEKRGSKR